MGFDPDLGCRWWFWVVGGLLAVLQGVRAAFLQRDLVERINAQRKSEEPAPLSGAARFWAYQVPDVILNCSCTVAGFVALAAVARLLGSVKDLSKMEVGTGIVLASLLFVAVAGIAGVLPLILWNSEYRAPWKAREK